MLNFLKKRTYWGGGIINLIKEYLNDLTKEDLLFLHLLNCNKYKNAYIAPEYLTQMGIKKEINCDLGFLSRILKENEVKGHIYRKKSKIVKKKKKQYVFYLSLSGLELAREINNTK